MDVLFDEGISRPLWKCKDIAYAHTSPSCSPKNPKPLKPQKPEKKPQTKTEQKKPKSKIPSQN